MKRQTHGLISLGCAAFALAVAVQSLFQQSFVIGIAYMFLAALSTPVILYSFCAKCEDRLRCGHVVAGPAAARMFRNRKPAPYTPGDLAATGAALAVIFLFPQIWLWRHPLAFGVFWICMAVAAVDIRRNVCAGCGNVRCPGNGSKKKSEG
jgi:hypothetical protein